MQSIHHATPTNRTPGPHLRHAAHHHLEMKNAAASVPTITTYQRPQEPTQSSQRHHFRRRNR
ncbi:hypothetical protein BD410DRAFT_791139 [Rickenella mellea]|uniref:Uncharacterized protein n=1 Tax=Rickenella mellea TaxID=50990 RepID=A0A4Y7Q0L5_9AGAM|nr:hypothetical protein BD410DRAFT_791139 [Rickenella mellea]